MSTTESGHAPASGLSTRAAVLLDGPGPYEIVELEMEDLRPTEIRVRMAAAGLCHSDDHFSKGTQTPGIFPIVGGHEGAGVVEAVGSHVTDLAVGDHVVFSFLPVCGRCKWCARGLQALCNLGAFLATGCRFDDPDTFRLSYEGRPVGQLAALGTFSEVVTVAALSAIKIPESIPLDIAVLTGCGVGTGWGSAVNAAEVRPGHVTIVMGIGGIGINAVQGAAHAGASAVIAVDPVAFKRDAALKLGATHAFATMEEAAEVGRSLTDGQGADSAVITTGILTGAHVGEGLAAIRKGGTCVVVGIGDALTKDGDINLHELTLHQKRLQGALFGMSSPTADIPAQLAMYQRGELRLDELVTARYALEDINQGFEDMNAGRNLRGVIVFD